MAQPEFLPARTGRAAPLLMALAAAACLPSPVHEPIDPTARAAIEAAVPAPVIETKAEGFGAITRGGEGGRILWVTHLESFGRGSLRDALTSLGPRLVRFRVGGTIKLDERIVVEDGRLTLDGLSAAPYGGVTVEGGVILRRCRDVIVRHVRFRGGYDPLSVDYSERVLVDHVSSAWGRDENLSVWGSRDVTLQWSIIAEGEAGGEGDTRTHSMGSLQSGGSHRVTTHHCLFTGNLDRNPLMSGPNPVPRRGSPAYRFDLLNTVVYNYYNGARVGEAAAVNLIGNTFRPGPDTDATRAPIMIQPVMRFPPLVHLDGNVGPGWNANGGGDRDLVVVVGGFPAGDRASGEAAGGADGSARAPWRPADAPLSDTDPLGVAIEEAGAAYEAVLALAGAWPRDAEDERLIREVVERTGAIGRVGPRWRELHEGSRKGP